MAGKCKVCASPLREEVEARLLRGESITSLSDWLKLQGESISAPSIDRHKKNHFVPTQTQNDAAVEWNAKNKQNASQDEIKPLIDTIAAMSKFEKEMRNTDVFASAINERKFTQLLIEKIMQKQLIIVSELQDKYISGEGAYPDPQIRGLKTILDMANSLPTYKNENLLSDIRVDNRINYEDKVIQDAVDLAQTEKAKYKPWHVLTTNPTLTTPFEKIDDLAKKLYPNSESSQIGWAGSMREAWRLKVIEELPKEWDVEDDLRRLIDRYLDDLYGTDFEPQIEKIRLKIVKAIMETFETPEKAHDDQDKVGELIEENLPTIEA